MCRSRVRCDPLHARKGAASFGIAGSFQSETPEIWKVNPFSPGAVLAGLLGICTLLPMQHAELAGNGLNDIGYGAESAGMAGGDLAVTGDPSALNINHAGLARIDNHAVNLRVEPFYLIDNNHREQPG